MTLKARLNPEAKKPPKGAMSEMKMAHQKACSCRGLRVSAPPSTSTGVYIMWVASGQSLWMRLCGRLKSKSKPRLGQTRTEEREARRAADADRLAKEAAVGDLLMAKGFWTSSTQFIKGQDMKDFLKAMKDQKHHAAASDSFSPTLAKEAAFAFLSSALDTYPPESWPKA